MIPTIKLWEKVFPPILNAPIALAYFMPKCIKNSKANYKTFFMMGRTAEQQ